MLGDGHALSRQGGLVDAQPHGFDQSSVCGDVCPRAKDQNVSADHFLDRDFGGLPLAKNERLRADEAFEGLNGFLCTAFGHVTDGCIERHNSQHHHRIPRRTGQQGHACCDTQQSNRNRPKLVEKPHKGGTGLWLGDPVRPVGEQPIPDGRKGKSVSGRCLKMLHHKLGLLRMPGRIRPGPGRHSGIERGRGRVGIKGSLRRCLRFRRPFSRPPTKVFAG